MDEDQIILYIRHANGAVSQVTTNQDRDSVHVPEGARLISAKAYAKEHAAITAANEEYVGALRLAEEEQQAGDYEALRAAGIPDTTARRLTGHAPAEV